VSNAINSRWPDARDDLAHVLATTTPSQRLEWLEDILDLAYEAGALDKARRLVILSRGEGEESQAP
jgi:hypothetical protein